MPSSEQPRTGEEPRIIVGFDGSDDALTALDYAIQEALGRSGLLHVIYAVDDSVLNSAWGIIFDVESVRSLGRELLDQASTRAQELGLPVERIRGEILMGQPGMMLTRASEGAAMLVVGRRASKGSEPAFVGSTAVGVAATAGCPVVVVAQPVGDVVVHHRITVGLDSSARVSPALIWAFRRAARLGSRIVVETAVYRPTGRFFGGASQQPTDEQYARMLEEARRRVEAALVPLRQEYPDVPVEVVTEVGPPVEKLIEASRVSDMLIVGVQPGFPTYSIGGKVRALMAHCECPLGIVRYH